MEANSKNRTTHGAASSQSLDCIGKKLQVDAVDPILLERERGRIDSELAELTALGVEVTGVALHGGAPRFAFRFPPGELQYRLRLALERTGFDVGQQIGDGRLTFYVSRRTQPSDGWND